MIFKADVIVSVGADFLDLAGGGFDGYAKGRIQKRKNV
jgi:hypothetical protein